MEESSKQLAQNVPQRRRTLETVSQFAIILGVVAFLGEAVVEKLSAASAAAATVAGDGEADKMLRQAYTSAQTAHITFTNLHSFTGSACVKAVVTSIATGRTIASMPVCTGEVKPRSTVSLEAQYSEIDGVKTLCPDNDSRIGGVDWNKCDFALEEID